MTTCCDIFLSAIETIDDELKPCILGLQSSVEILARRLLHDLLCESTAEVVEERETIAIKRGCTIVNCAITEQPGTRYRLIRLVELSECVTHKAEKR